MLFIHYPDILTHKSAHDAEPRVGGTQSRWRSSPILYLLLAFLFSLGVRAETNTQLSLARPLIIKWQYETQELLNVSPAVHKEAIALPLSGGNLVSLRLPDGKMIWRAELGGEITASPFADDSGVYVATSPEAHQAGNAQQTSQGVLRALGAESGVTLWSIKLPSLLTGSLAATRTAIIGRSMDGRIYSIKKETGRILWVRRNDQPFTTSPFVASDRLFAGSADGSLFAIDLDTGKAAWRYRTPQAINLPLSIDDQTIYLASGNNDVYAISAKEGRLRWRRRAPARIQSVVSTRRGVLVTCLDNSVSLLSTSNGKRIWKQQMNGRVTAPPVADMEAALFAPLSGEECVVLELKTGKRLNAVYVGEDNNTSAAPLIDGDMLFLITRKGLLAFADSD